MQSGRGTRVLVWALAGVTTLIAAHASSPAHGAGAPTSEIVFASDRASANPGEIYALAAGHAPVDVSRSPAADSIGAVSPDGRLVAFWSDRNGAPRVFLARGDGASIHPLPQAFRFVRSGGPGELAFSPDGRLLLVTVYGSNAACSLYLVSLPSLQTSSLGRRGCPIASPWSPDGSRIATFLGPAPARIIVYDTRGHPRVSVPGYSASWSSLGSLAVEMNDSKTALVVAKSGARVARLSGMPQAWSGDGKRLALARPGAIVLADLTSGAPRTRVLLHLSKGSVPFGLAFTPDGAFVRYLARRGFVALPVAGGRPRPIAGYGVWSSDGHYAYERSLQPAQRGGLPRIKIEIGDEFGHNARAAGVFPADDHGVQRLTWSGNGRRVFYETSVRAPSDLWAVEANGSNLRRLTPGGPSLSAPAWSPDGQRLAYVTAPFSGGNCGFCSTWVAIAGPDAVERSIVSGSGDGDPSWDPTGTQLTVEVCCSGERDVVGADGSGRRKLSTGVINDFIGAAAWSPVGNTIAYSGSGGIFLMAADGTGRHVLVPGPEANALAWSHDGKLLAYTNAAGVHVVPADSSAAPRLVTAAVSAGRLSFSPDDTQLVYAAQPGHVTQHDLLVVSVAGGKPRPLVTSPYDDYDPAWRPAG